MEMVSSFLKTSWCVGVERRIVVLAKKNSITFYLPYIHPYMKSLHKSDEAWLDMVHVSFTAGAFPTASTTTSSGTNSSANNDVLYIKHSIALAGLNKLETESMNWDIAELANVFHAMFSLN